MIMFTLQYIYRDIKEHVCLHLYSMTVSCILSPEKCNLHQVGVSKSQQFNQSATDQLVGDRSYVQHISNGSSLTL